MSVMDDLNDERNKLHRYFLWFSWLTLSYTVGVILWGAFVRATGSGAGCGAHWPACNGVVIPRSPSVETMIEYSHRLTSGLALLLVAAMFVWAMRLYKKGHALRWASGWSLIFIVIEALIGAGLVLLGLVADNDSTGRAFAVGVHLVNTFILLGFLTYCAWYSYLRIERPAQLRCDKATFLFCGAAVVLFLCVGASGAVVALGDTLFPATSLQSGWQEKFSPAAHFLVRLRWIHPIVAVATSFFLIFVVGVIKARRGQDRYLQGSGSLVVGMVVLQLAIGLINVVLLAPTWMQLVHLLVADALWIGLVVFCLHAIADPLALTAAPSRAAVGMGGVAAKAVRTT